VVQVAPIKPTLKAPETQRLKRKYDKLLSSLAFRFNLRRYTKGKGSEEEDSDAGESDEDAWGEAKKQKHHTPKSRQVKAGRQRL
jgi:hypothetical protein